jgi:hypothetical protein
LSGFEAVDGVAPWTGLAPGVCDGSVVGCATPPAGGGEDTSGFAVFDVGPGINVAAGAWGGDAGFAAPAGDVGNRPAGVVLAGGGEPGPGDIADDGADGGVTETPFADGSDCLIPGSG